MPFTSTLRSLNLGSQPVPRPIAWVLRHGMVLLVVTVLAWSWLVSLWFIGEQKRHLLTDRGGELALMAGAIAEQSAGVLRAIDSDLRTIDLWLQTHPDADPTSDPRLMRLIDEMRRASRGTLDLRMVAEDGGLYYLPTLDGKPRANVSDRGYVTAHADGGNASPGGLHVGAPVRSRVTQRWDVPISRALTAPQPHWAHTGKPRMRIVFAAVSIERLAAEHERMRFPEGGAIALVRADGIVLSRAPLITSFLGRDLSKAPQFIEHYGRHPQGSFVSDGAATDGVARLVSYERLEGFPVAVLVSRGLDEIFTAYYARLRIVLVLSALLSLVVLGVTAFLHRSQVSRRALQAAQDHLRRLATTDELTGVMNRRAFTEAARRELERAHRYARPMAVLALDIDHFKRVNDEYGHSGGDLVLRLCASRWQSALREQDVLGRMGGEEFCVLLPETTAASAAVVADRLCGVTAGTPIMGQERRVTVSVGWTTVDVTDATWEAVYERADKALYTAKTQGRNCVRPARPADEAKVDEGPADAAPALDDVAH